MDINLDINTDGYGSRYRSGYGSGSGSSDVMFSPVPKVLRDLAGHKDRE